MTRGFLLCAASTLAPGTVAAQRVATTLDLGGVKLRYADSVDAAAATLSPALSLTWSRASADVAGTLSQFDTGNWAVQGSLGAAVFVPAGRRLAGELAGSAGGSAHEDGERTGQGLAIGRAHFMKNTAGLWVGAGAGRVWDGDLWQGLRHVEGGGWVSFAGATALATVSPTAVGDTIRYTDAQLFVRWQLSRVELGGSAGWRSGSRLPTYGGGGTTWGNANAAVWVTSRIALVASGGSYPVDLTQGFPGGRYASLGLRLASRARTPESGWTGRGARELAATRVGVTGFGANAVAGGQHTLRVRATSARMVEISGDFTGWQATRLAPAGNGWWSLTLPIAAGTHQVSIRVDGGEWVAPPGLVTVSDEFGGEAGLLLIDEPGLL